MFSREENNKNKKCKLDLTRSQILVITALLAGTLDVESILIDKNQEIQILLTGSLRINNNKDPNEEQLDKIMALIGQMPFDDVIKSLIRRY